MRAYPYRNLLIPQCLVLCIGVALSGCTLPAHSIRMTATSTVQRSTPIPICSAQQVRFARGYAAGMGHITVWILMKHTQKGSACRIRYWPGVQRMNRTGQNLPTVIHRHPGSAMASTKHRFLDVSPDQSTYLRIHFADATGYLGPGEPYCPRADVLALDLGPGVPPITFKLITNAYGGLASHPVCGTMWVSAWRRGEPPEWSHMRPKPLRRIYFPGQATDHEG